MNTATDTVDPKVMQYYTTDYDESLRLGATMRGQLEAARVRQLLVPYLDSPIADVGGGPGVHAKWFIEQGCTVDLLDPIAWHVEQAAEVGVRDAVIGDAISLPWEDHTYGLTLLAGPLYHLGHQARIQALKEAVRITKPGGFVAGVAINRFANLIGSAIANQVPERSPVVNDILTQGYSDMNDRVPQMYYHQPGELLAEMHTAGFSNVQLFGTTGPGGWLTIMIERHLKGTGTPIPETLTSIDPLENALQAAKMADLYPELVTASAQLMAIGQC